MDNLSNAPAIVTDDELCAEVARLREVNDDLRASALRWKQLYEAAMSRGRDADAPLLREDARLELQASGHSRRHPS
jgi:hypothetical protein